MFTMSYFVAMGMGRHAVKRKSVGERVTEIEQLCGPKKSTEIGTAVDALKCGIADRLPICEDKDPAYRTIWRREDDILIRKMAVRMTNKKWEIIKLSRKMSAW